MAENTANAPAPEEQQDLRAYYNAKRRGIHFYDQYATTVPLHGCGGGRAAFLISSGPSLNEINLKLLEARGVVTMAVNNAPAAMVAQGLRMPNYWTCVDTPTHFIEQIWRDPGVMKFCPFGHVGRKIKLRNSTGGFVDSPFKVEDCPNVFFIRRKETFKVADWLTESEFCWGNPEAVTDELGIKGSRSVMLVALKALYALGFGEVYLLGADFKMEDGRDNYAFKQDRTPQSVRGNNGTYKALNARFAALQPYFQAAGFKVYNCNFRSGLTAFPFHSFEEAVAKASKEVTANPINTIGHYELP